MADIVLKTTQAFYQEGTNKQTNQQTKGKTEKNSS